MTEVWRALIINSRKCFLMDLRDNHLTQIVSPVPEGLCAWGITITPVPSCLSVCQPKTWCPGKGSQWQESETPHREVGSSSYQCPQKQCLIRSVGDRDPGRGICLRATESIFPLNCCFLLQKMSWLPQNNYWGSSKLCPLRECYIRPVCMFVF